MRAISVDKRLETLARGAAILAVLYLTGGLLWLLPSPGYTTVRFLFFLLVLACGWVGTLGVLRRQTTPLAIGVGGLVVLGFCQAVLWVFMLPTALVLLIAALVVYEPFASR